MWAGERALFAIVITVIITIATTTSATTAAAAPQSRARAFGAKDGGDEGVCRGRALSHGKDEGGARGAEASENFAPVHAAFDFHEGQRAVSPRSSRVGTTCCAFAYVQVCARCHSHGKPVSNALRDKREVRSKCVSVHQ